MGRNDKFIKVKNGQYLIGLMVTINYSYMNH